MKLLIIPFLLITLTVFSQNTKQGTITVKKKPIEKIDTFSSSESVIEYFGVIANFDTLQAEFIGGEQAMKKFINSNLKYPVNSRYKGLRGSSVVNFTVATDGRISNVRVLFGMPDCTECDNEVIRIVKLMPNWKPGVYQPTGQNVISTGRVSVRFNFPK
jgi:TonB family protein